MWYRKLKANVIRCELCPRNCIIKEGEVGFCRVRKNKGGRIVSLVYGKPSILGVAPIEKAPIYHFLPGHKRLTLACVGCNLACKHCQNWDISQASPDEVPYLNLSPSQIIEEAEKRGLNSISFTYTEPTVFYEYIYDIAKLAKRKNYKISLVSNGYINPLPLKKLLNFIDAANIDLKGFSQNFYSTISSAKLEPVLNTLKLLKENDIYFEIVNLIIPTLNDNLEEIKSMCSWIIENLGTEIPLHFTRFMPAYNLTHLPPTPLDLLEKAVELAYNLGLKYVYIGNVWNHKYNSTYCPNCQKLLIFRNYMSVVSNYIKEGKCKFCGYKIVGIWK
jgi:pyruvate formate lyase activating enzyme